MWVLPQGTYCLPIKVPGIIEHSGSSGVGGINLLQPCVDVLLFFSVSFCLPASAVPGICCFSRITNLFPGLHAALRLQVCTNKKVKSDTTPDPRGHRPQRPCAQGRTCAKQEQAQGAAPGHTQNRIAGGATTSG